MAYYNSAENKIYYMPDVPWTGHAGWVAADCGCSAGLQWGGESPRECRDCDGIGILAKHEESGVLAVYPGGPFVGRCEKCGKST